MKESKWRQQQAPATALATMHPATYHPYQTEVEGKSPLPVSPPVSRAKSSLPKPNPLPLLISAKELWNFAAYKEESKTNISNLFGSLVEWKYLFSTITLLALMMLMRNLSLKGFFGHRIHVQ